MSSAPSTSAPTFGKAFLDYSSKGKLVPDDISIGLWSAQIESMVQSGRFKPDIDFLVLDGIPRNVSQAKMLDSKLDVRRVFHLTCSDKTKIYDRLQAPRAEGKPASTTSTRKSSRRRLKSTRRKPSPSSISTARSSSPTSTPTSGPTRSCATSSTTSSTSANRSSNLERRL